MIKFLDLAKQYKTIQNEIDEAIKTVLAEAAFIGGKYVKQFEEEFSAYQEAKYCIGVGNGTDALEIAIEALELPKGSEIIVPANTFIASAEAVTRTGHKVVFCDCDSNNYTILIDSLRSKISEKTRAVICVHLYGHPCDMDKLLTIAKEYNLKVIEDCAQAHGAEYKGRKVGAIGDVGAFSFYPGKNLGAYGDGGTIVTNNESLTRKCRMIANHGRIEKYNHEFEGRNSRLDGLQAAVLSAKLKHLDEWNNKRIAIANYYIKNLSDISEIVLPKKEELVKHVYHIFAVRTKRRDELKKYLEGLNIQVGIHYPISLPKLKAYEYLGQDSDDFIANTISSELLSLPIGDHLTENDLDCVIKAIREFYK